jgi:hypothetical protein
VQFKTPKLERGKYNFVGSKVKHNDLCFYSRRNEGYMFEVKRIWCRPKCNVYQTMHTQYDFFNFFFFFFVYEYTYIIVHYQNYAHFCIYLIIYAWYTYAILAYSILNSMDPSTPTHIYI